jgi:hypothetical protein
MVFQECHLTDTNNHENLKYILTQDTETEVNKLLLSSA